MRLLQTREVRVSRAVLVDTGHVANEPEPAERLRRLENDARMKRIVYESHRCHGCEVSMRLAEREVERFLELHPELAR